jgi:hypothetical protein
MPLPTFREVGSKKTFRAPYQASGIRFYGFFLSADPTQLADLCKTALGSPGPIQYRPVSPFVMLSFTEIAKIASTTEPDASQGFVPERESALWVLTVAEKKELGVLEVAQHLAFYIPYIFVDSPNALLTGREVEGFPKEMAEVDVADPARMSAKAWAFPRYAPTTEVTLLPVAAATRNDPAEPEPAVLWNSVAELVEGLEKELFAGEVPVIPGITLLLSVVEAIMKCEVSLVFLKQLRDVTDSTKACYQAIVEAPIRVTEFRSASLLPGTYAIDLASFDSHPIVAQLGLDPASMQSVQGFFVDFDFLLEQGNVVWNSAGGT